MVSAEIRLDSVVGVDLVVDLVSYLIEHDVRVLVEVARLADDRSVCGRPVSRQRCRRTPSRVHFRCCPGRCSPCRHPGDHNERTGRPTVVVERRTVSHVPGYRYQGPEPGVAVPNLLFWDVAPPFGDAGSDTSDREDLGRHDDVQVYELSQRCRPSDAIHLARVTEDSFGDDRSALGHKPLSLISCCSRGLVGMLDLRVGPQLVRQTSALTNGRCETGCRILETNVDLPAPLGPASRCEQCSTRRRQRPALRHRPDRGPRGCPHHRHRPRRPPQSRTPAPG